MLSGVEPVTGAAAAAASAIEKSGLLPRLLGPLADEIGADLVARHRQRNAEKVARKAIRRLGARLDQNGAVNPRVAHRVFEEGSYVEDDVMLEYLAGTLAAARTPDGRDDRGAYYANIVAALSANQIRIHHAMCSALATTPVGPQMNFTDGATLFRNAVYTPMMLARQLLVGPRSEDDVSSPNLVAETVVGLGREGLLTDYAVSHPRTLRYSGFDVPVVMLVPSTLALHLFLWAYGIHDGDVNGIDRCLNRPFDPPGPVFAEFRLDPVSIHELPE
jgi:hypothetical protein